MKCPPALSQSLSASCAELESPLAEPQAKEAFDFVLMTHCGIRWASFKGKWWVTPHLDDGNGNPPDGWDNPGQRGHVRLLSDDRAIFKSEGHEPLLFRATEHRPRFGCA